MLLKFTNQLRVVCEVEEDAAPTWIFPMLPARAYLRVLARSAQTYRHFAAETKSWNIDITQSCVERINFLTKSKGHQVALRVTVDGGGCSGFQYVFALETPPPDSDKNKNDDDNYFSRDGASVIVDNLSLAYINGAKIDYVEEMISSSFQVADNPNSESSCGCGVSFAAKT